MVGMSVGLAVGLWFMARWIGNVFPIATCVRVLIAGAAVYAIGMLWHPDGKMITLVRCVACGALYLLLVAGEGLEGLADPKAARPSHPNFQGG